MPSRRAIVLDEIERWRAEGLLDEATYDRLRWRASGMPEEPEEDRASFGLQALQLVGGLLLGAAAVALMLVLHYQRDAGAILLDGIAAAALAGGLALQRAGGERQTGLADAACAAGLVAAGVAAFFPDERVTWAAWVGAALALVATFASRGRTPVVALASVAFAVATGRATMPFDASLLHAAWWVASAAYVGLLLSLWRHEGWTSVALAAQVVPLTISVMRLLDDAGVHGSVSTELGVGAFLALVLGVGIALAERGLVAGAAAGLLIDAIVFAFDVGGAMTALLVLLALGGLLVWQAQVLRGWFRRRAA